MNFSIVIPTRNRQDLVIQCLLSIDQAARDYEGKLEVILVNNNSTDQTKKKYEDFLASTSHPFFSTRSDSAHHLPETQEYVEQDINILFLPTMTALSQMTSSHCMRRRGKTIQTQPL
jgi:cellulose synthase/poly-beta-1,6-N-acetylglucosamine synthase-like glycosyltransferase